MEAIVTFNCGHVAGLPAEEYLSRRGLLDIRQQLAKDGQGNYHLQDGETDCPACLAKNQKDEKK